MLAEVEEPVHPGDAGSGEDGGTEGYEDSGSAFAGGGVVAVGGRDGPDDRGDDQHEDGDDEDEGQERADDGAEVSDAAEAVEVGKHVHRRSPTRVHDCEERSSSMPMRCAAGPTHGRTRRERGTADLSARTKLGWQPSVVGRLNPVNDDVFILGVPAEEAHDLRTLADQVSTDAEFAEHRYFDGATFVEVLLPLVLSTATWATVRTWIRSRAEVLKATRISMDGVEITAMKPKDAERIIKLLSDRVAIEDADR